MHNDIFTATYSLGSVPPEPQRIIGKLPRVKDKDGKEWVRVGKIRFEKEWMIENMTMMKLMGKM